MRERYSFAHCIGLVRIDFSDSDEGGIYHISEKLNTALNEALEGTVEMRTIKRGAALGLNVSLLIDLEAGCYIPPTPSSG